MTAPGAGGGLRSCRGAHPRGREGGVGRGRSRQAGDGPQGCLGLRAPGRPSGAGRTGPGPVQPRRSGGPAGTPGVRRRAGAGTPKGVGAA